MPHVKRGGFVLKKSDQTCQSLIPQTLPRMASKPERPRALFSQSKQQQQIEKASAAGGIKQAAVASK